MALDEKTKKSLHRVDIEAYNELELAYPMDKESFDKKWAEHIDSIKAKKVEAFMTFKEYVLPALSVGNMKASNERILPSMKEFVNSVLEEHYKLDVSETKTKQLHTITAQLIKDKVLEAQPEVNFISAKHNPNEILMHLTLRSLYPKLDLDKLNNKLNEFVEKKLKETNVNLETQENKDSNTAKIKM